MLDFFRRYEYRADGMRTLKIEGLTIAWQYYDDDEKHEKGSGYYDAIWSWNQPTTRYYYDGQMGFEDDYAYSTGSYGSSTSHLDISRYALGAKGIDRIEKTLDSTSSSPTTVIQYPLYDAHGNMVATLGKGSSAGTYTVGNQRAFEPWGSVFDSSGLSNTPKQAYCASIGHVADGELGFTYMRARYYEPGTGRFISEDPALQGINWYVYCSNDPVGRSDQSGKSALSVIAQFLQIAVFFLGELLLDMWFHAGSKVYTLTKYIRELESLLAHGVDLGGSVEDLVTWRRELNEAKSLLTRAKFIKAGQVVLKILGYAMIVKAFLMDIDFGDSQSGLDILFGR